MGAFSERQVEAEGGAPSLVTPVRLEGMDERGLKLFRDLADILMAKVLGDQLDHYPAVRFAAEGQERLTNTFSEGLIAPRRLFAVSRV
jgi:hypothetical protein